MWIKICGITSLEDAEQAIAAGADAIGFVFAESPRRVTPELARGIVADLPSSIEKIGVFVDTTSAGIADICRRTGLTGVQLHGALDASGRQNLRAHLAETSALLRVLQVLRYDGDSASFALELRRLAGDPADGTEDALLVDTCVIGKQGGTGIAFDWQGARRSFLQEAAHLRVIAAGGLRPENVREAVLTLEPWGVDVSSGVEASAGKKDPRRVADFIRAAREAWAELGLPAGV